MCQTAGLSRGRCDDFLEQTIILSEANLRTCKCDSLNPNYTNVCVYNMMNAHMHTDWAERTHHLFGGEYQDFNFTGGGDGIAHQSRYKSLYLVKAEQHVMHFTSRTCEESFTDS